jgi:hypothetical protein
LARLVYDLLVCTRIRGWATDPGRQKDLSRWRSKGSKCGGPIRQTQHGPFEAAPDAKPTDAKLSAQDVPPRLKLAGAVVRAIFMCLLIAVILRVSSPQSETIWSAYETPSDLVRMGLGLAAGAWILVHVFIPPKDPGSYRTWLYLGLVLVPFITVCAIVVW